MHAQYQRLVSVVKMATVLEEYTTDEQFSVVLFFFAKELNTLDIHEMFPDFSGKYLLHKAVHNWVKKFSQGRLKVAHDA
jgi:transposase-like protein